MTSLLHDRLQSSLTFNPNTFFDVRNKRSNPGMRGNFFKRRGQKSNSRWINVPFIYNTSWILFVINVNFAFFFIFVSQDYNWLSTVRIVRGQNPASKIPVLIWLEYLRIFFIIFFFYKHILHLILAYRKIEKNIYMYVICEYSSRAGDVPLYQSQGRI